MVKTFQLNLEQIEMGVVVVESKRLGKGHNWTWGWKHVEWSWALVEEAIQVCQINLEFVKQDWD